MKSVINSKQKIAIFIAGVIAALTVGIGLTVSPKAVKAETGLAPGTLVAHDAPVKVIKDTICVKRWEECTFDLYYMGAYDDVFIAELHRPIQATSISTITFSSSTQIMSSYSVTETVSTSVSLEMGITEGISLEGFMKEASAKATSTVTASYAATVSTSTTKIDSYSVVIDVDGLKNPLNYMYGDLLMINHAYKFKLVVYKQHRAKHRKSALHKWGAYQVETAQTTETYFYTLNGSNGFFYQKTGKIGTSQEYYNVINNIGK